jgi:hypothetical protein
MNKARSTVDSHRGGRIGGKGAWAWAFFLSGALALAGWFFLSGKRTVEELPVRLDAENSPQVIPPPAVLAASRTEDEAKRRVAQIALAGRSSRALTLDELKIEAAGLYSNPGDVAIYLGEGLLPLGARAPREMIRFLEDTSFPGRGEILGIFLSAWDEETFETAVSEPAYLLDAVRGLASESPAEVAGVLDHLPEGDLRDILAFEIAEVWMSVSPDAALTWFTTLDESPSRSMAAAAIAESWPDQDFAAAALWAGEIEELSSRNAAVEAVLSQWLRKTPGEALSWFEREFPRSHPEFLELAPLVAEFLAGSDAKGAFSWVERLPPGGAQKDALFAAALGSSTVDPAGAFSLLRELSVSNAPLASESPEVVFHLVSAWSGEDPVAVVEHLESLESSPFRDSATLGFVSIHADEEPAASMEWALTISDSEKRGEGVGLVVEAWMRESGRKSARRDIEAFSNGLESSGRKDEAGLVRGQSKSILFPAD